MVKETEEFKKFLQSKPQNPAIGRMSLAKAVSSPLSSDSLMTHSRKLCRTQSDLNENTEGSGFTKMLGPIERPNNASGNSTLTSNRSLDWLTLNYQNNDLLNHLNQPTMVNNFSEFKLFGEEVKSQSSAVSIWPTATQNTHSILTNKSSNQAWNSVLINDFDTFTPDSPLLDHIDSSLVDSSGNTIKSIWSNKLDDLDENKIKNQK